MLISPRLRYTLRFDGRAPRTSLTGNRLLQYPRHKPAHLYRVRSHCGVETQRIECRGCAGDRHARVTGQRLRFCSSFSVCVG